MSDMVSISPKIPIRGETKALRLSIDRIATTAALSGIQAHVTIFEEKYKVIDVESHSLTIRGVLSGNILRINTDSELCLDGAEFAVGNLILLSDPSAAPPN
jgi:hypothetical protein